MTTERMVRTIARCSRCKAITVGETIESTTVRDGKTFVFSNPASTTCTCGAFVKPSAVRGAVSEKRCGAGCTHAKGPSCSCECGGENHASGWAA